VNGDRVDFADDDGFGAGSLPGRGRPGFVEARRRVTWVVCFVTGGVVARLERVNDNVFLVLGRAGQQRVVAVSKGGDNAHHHHAFPCCLAECRVVGISQL
jgi:hypothetical protein